MKNEFFLNIKIKRNINTNVIIIDHIEKSFFMYILPKKVKKIMKKVNIKQEILFGKLKTSLLIFDSEDIVTDKTININNM